MEAYPLSESGLRKLKGVSVGVWSNRIGQDFLFYIKKNGSMPNDEYTEKLQKLLDEMRQEIESNLSTDVEKMKQKEQKIDEKELQQEKKLEQVDPCEEALLASEQYWELATQIELLAVFGEIPDDLREKARELESRIGKLKDKCSDDSKERDVNINIKEAEKRLENAYSTDKTLNMSIEEIIKELEHFN